MTEREKELERVILALRKQQALLLDAISVHLGEGKEINLQEAIAYVRAAGSLLTYREEELKKLEEKLKTE